MDEGSRMSKIHSIKYTPELNLEAILRLYFPDLHFSLSQPSWYTPARETLSHVRCLASPPFPYCYCSFPVYTRRNLIFSWPRRLFHY